MRIIEKFKNKLSFYCFLAIITKILFDYLILNFLPQIYIHSLTYDINFSLLNCIVGWMFFIPIMVYTLHLTVKKRYDNFSIFIIIVFYLYYIPLNSVFYLQSRSFGFLILSSLFWIILVKLSGIRLESINVDNSKEIINTEKLSKSKLFIIVCIVMDIACILYAYKYNGLNLTFDISNIYDARAKYVGTSSMFESILSNFGGGLLVALSMYMGIRYRKYILFFLSLFTQIALFSISRQKGTLLIVLVVIGLYLLNKIKKLDSIKAIIPVGILGLCIAALLEISIVRTNYIFMLLVRRMMFIPAWLNSLYYDFFQTHNVLLMSQDVFLVERLGLNVYSESILSIINSSYFEGYMPSPNTGLFAEAYMHFGILGCFIFPIIDVLLLKMMFWAVKYYDKGIQLLITIELALSATNLPLTSGIFSVTYYFFIPLTFVLIKLQRRR